MQKTLKRSIVAITAASIMVFSQQPAWAAPGNYNAEAGLAVDYIANNVTDLTSLAPSGLGQLLDAHIAFSAVDYNGAGLSSSQQYAQFLMDMEIDAEADDYCNPTSTADRNVGGCAKVAIALMASGQQAGVGGNVDTYVAAITTASNYNQYATNQALAIIALARAGEQIPRGLYNTAIDWSTDDSSYFPDTDTVGLMLTALSHVDDPSTTHQDAIINLQARLAEQKALDTDGWGLTYSPSDGQPTQANINSTAWAAPGADRTGDTDLKILAENAQYVFLDNQDLSTGEISDTSRWDVMMSTAQSVPPMLGLRSYDNAGDSSTAASLVRVQTTNQVTMSSKGEPYARVGSPTAPIVVLGNVPSGMIVAQVLGGPGLMMGMDGFTYCDPTKPDIYSPVPGATATGNVSNNMVSYSSRATLSTPGCYKWQVTLVIGTTTFTQTTEPFAVR